MALNDPLHSIQISSVPITRLDRVPLAGTVLEATPPLGQVWALLGVAGAVAGLDHPEAPVRQEAEAVGVVLHSGHGRAR